MEFVLANELSEAYIGFSGLAKVSLSFMEDKWILVLEVLIKPNPDALYSLSYVCYIFQIENRNQNHAGMVQPFHLILQGTENLLRSQSQGAARPGEELASQFSEGHCHRHSPESPREG